MDQRIISLLPPEAVGVISTFLDLKSVGRFGIVVGSERSSAMKVAILKHNFRLLYEHPNFYPTFLQINADWRDIYDDPKLQSGSFFQAMFCNVRKLIRHSQVDILRHLIEIRREVGVNEKISLKKGDDKVRCTLLYYALMHGNNDILRYILGISELDVNATHWNPKKSSNASALHFAAESEDVEPEKLALLLSHPRINVNITDQGGRTPLYFLCEDKHVLPTAEKKIHLLLSHGGLNIDITDGDGGIGVGRRELELLMKVGINNESVLRHLLEIKGGEVDRRRTLIHALHFGGLRLLDAALGVQGLDINSKQDKHGRSILHWAMADRNTTSSNIELLLSHRSIDVNVTDNLGQTPLHYVAKHKCVGGKRMLKRVRLLLAQRGVNVGAADVRGRTALSIAARRTGKRSEAFVQLLLEAGGESRSITYDIALSPLSP